MAQHQTHALTSRRTLLTAAAWSVPAISLAAASPAYANSDELLAITSTSASFTSTQTGMLFTGTVTVKNTGNAPTENLQLSVTLPPAYVTSLKQISTPATTGNWAPALTGLLTTQQPTFSATSQLAPQGSSTLSFSIGVSGTLPDPLPPMSLVVTSGSFATTATAVQPTID